MHMQEIYKISPEDAKFVLETVEMSACFRVFTCVNQSLWLRLDLITTANKV